MRRGGARDFSTHQVIARPRPCKHSDPPCSRCLSIRERVRRYDAAHRRQHVARSKAWKARNPSKVSDANRRSNAARRVSKRTWSSARRATLRGFTQVEWISILDVYERAEGICALCETPVPAPYTEQEPADEATIDHVVPLSAPGSPGHVASNVQLAHKGCNSRKGARLPDDLADVPF